MYRTIVGMLNLELGISLEDPDTGKTWERIDCPYCHKRRAVISTDADWFNCWTCGEQRSIGGNGLFDRFRRVIWIMPEYLRSEGFASAYKAHLAELKQSGWQGSELTSQAWLFVLGYTNGKEGWPNDSGKLAEWAESVDYDDNLIDSYVITALKNDMHDWASQQINKTKDERGAYQEKMGDSDNLNRGKAKHTTKDDPEDLQFGFDREADRLRIDISEASRMSDHDSKKTAAAYKGSALDWKSDDYYYDMRTGPIEKGPAVATDFSEEESSLYEYRYLYMSYAQRMTLGDIAGKEEISTKTVGRRIEAETEAYRNGEPCPVHRGDNYRLSSDEQAGKRRKLAMQVFLPGELFKSLKLADEDKAAGGLPLLTAPRMPRDRAVGDFGVKRCMHDMVPAYCGDCYTVLPLL